MKLKHVYLIRDLPTAEKVLAMLRAHGVPEHDVALIARADIEMTQIPDDYRNASTDFMPAALRGALGGGTAGMLAGLIGVAIPAIGVTIAGVAAIAAIGAATGAWASALMGSALPDPIRRQFEQEISEGRIMLTIDASEETHPAIHQKLVVSGAQQMSFSEPTMLG